VTRKRDVPLAASSQKLLLKLTPKLLLKLTPKKLTEAPAQAHHSSSYNLLPVENDMVNSATGLFAAE
jgi:hypothetical protein